MANVYETETAGLDHNRNFPVTVGRPRHLQRRAVLSTQRDVPDGPGRQPCAYDAQSRIGRPSAACLKQLAPRTHAIGSTRSLLGIFLVSLPAAPRRARPHRRTRDLIVGHSHPVRVPLGSLPVAAAGLQEDGSVVEANDRFCRLFGCDPIRSRTRLSDLVVDAHRQTVVNGLREFAINRQQQHLDMRLRALCAHSSQSWLTIQIRRLRWVSTVPCIVYALPASTKEASSTSSIAAFAASGSGASWPPLLSMLSHELRGSVNAIRGWAAAAEGGSLPSDRFPGAFGVISRHAQSLCGLVETLFDLSRNASGSLMLTLETIDLNQLAVLVVDSTYAAARRHRVALHFNCARTPLFVNGDRIRLEQILRTLLDNAIKFTPSGGSVMMRTSRCVPFCELIVHDTGAGISRDLLPVIFDPCRQGLAPLASRDAGLGLGLALAHELVHLHHGHIWARSAGEGFGSTFTVRLPLAPSSGGGDEDS